MAITTILFDLGNVLLYFDPGKALKEMAKHLNPLTALLLAAKKNEFMKELRGEADLLETGRMTIEQFFSRLKGKIGLNLEFEQFKVIWNDIFSPNHEVLALARDLSMRHPCYILSNTNEPHFKFVLERYPELAFAKGHAVSYELGVLKPAREFFDKALAHLGLQAGECVFIDDLPENVEGAKQAGIAAIPFVNAGQLKADLSVLGIG